MGFPNLGTPFGMGPNSEDYSISGFILGPSIHGNPSSSMITSLRFGQRE